MEEIQPGLRDRPVCKPLTCQLYIFMHGIHAGVQNTPCHHDKRCKENRCRHRHLHRQQEVVLHHHFYVLNISAAIPPVCRGHCSHWPTLLAWLGCRPTSASADTHGVTICLFSPEGKEFHREKTMKIPGGVTAAATRTWSLSANAAICVGWYGSWPGPCDGGKVSVRNHN